MQLLSFYSSSNSKQPTPSTSSSTAANNGKSSSLAPSTSTTTTASSLLTPDDEDKAEEQLFKDMLSARKALDLFLDSRIPEAEAILEPHLCKTSMYYALGKSVLLTLKSMMTFQQTDFEVAIESLKHTVQLSSHLIRKGHGTLWFLENITSWVRAGLSVDTLQKMRPLYRHAELVHAEAYLLKAMICIIHDESLVSFLREGLHIRQSYMTYTVLEKFVQTTDEPLDDHFTSGVKFGVGCFNLMLSLLPKTVIKLVQFIGFSGQRLRGLELLESSGGWDTYKQTGVMVERQGPAEGLRRQFCDMALVGYHIVLAKLMPMSHVDDDLAGTILKYNLDLYPNGVFFLYFHGRQLFSERKLDEANAEYIRAIETQKEWVQLQHICYWERGLISILQRDWKTASDIYEILYKDSNWSKSVYAYFRGMTLYMLAQQEKDDKKCKSLMAQASYMMKKVPSLRQKIAGKSIPLEKFVARKARKFLDQDNVLMFSDLEITNAFGACDYIPVNLLWANIDRLDIELSQLCTTHKNYADDLCLGNYLLAYMTRLLLTKIEDNNEKEMDKLRGIHHKSIQIVLNAAKDVQFDHYVYYFARYENARMLIIEGDYDAAEQELEVVLNANDKSQYNIGAGSKAKSKYSLENHLLFKCHNCVTELEELRKQQDKQQRLDDNSDNDSFASAASDV
ncbi:hypothetical protein BDB00DRAFT_836900 [Zychaea mexicana]|uniref:uncharacterized protein n=1 Tax=Zychaea mexicana TaxID=64656 RepID=UPI0022FE0D61|nr:uncharacterized protein BDB00DRAFT_836900 [Zychaea mexicana]KAI9490681.1 hypothetical protein BDB00DRAFT_836900 [Zychaea mexicana]